MLLPYLPVLNEKKIILGSQSKSRNELITTQNIKYERISSKFAEDLDKESFASPDLYNLETCKGKVKDLLQTFKKEDKQWDMLICGDTIVCDGNRIIEKPVDAEDCIKMMSSLANKTHHVYTAHCLLFNTEPMITYEWVGTAAVTFGDVPLECFKEYSKLDEPYIHSGGYELTAVSGSFLKEINGSHTLVQGLDIYELCNKIIEGSRKAKWLE